MTMIFVIIAFVNFGIGVYTGTFEHDFTKGTYHIAIAAAMFASLAISE